MKTFTATILALLLIGCSKPQVVGRVNPDLQVDFDASGTRVCLFDNDPHPGDDVTQDKKTGVCHAIPHKD